MKNLKIIFSTNVAKLFFAIILVLISHNSFARTIKAKIVKVVDGDTVIARTVNNKKIKIRLSGIDAPEKKQTHGIDAKNYLKKLIFSKVVKIVISNKDRYKRHLGTIFLQKTNINLQLVKSGNAWAYRKYLKKMNIKMEEAYIRAESFAQYNKKGLWKENSPIPPWLWRKNN